MMSQRLFENWIMMQNQQRRTSAAQPQSSVQFEEDGDVIMQDAPGAAPADENQNSNKPLLEQWAPSNTFRR